MHRISFVMRRISFDMHRISFVMLLALLASCSRETDVLVPDYNAAVVLDGTDSIPQATGSGISGVYAVEEGAPLLGNPVVLKWSGTSLSIFSGKDAGLCVFEGGMRDSAFVFAGYWRKCVNLETGVMELGIAAAAGGRRLAQGLPPREGDIVVEGSYAPGEGQARKTLRLRYLRPLHAGTRDFFIIAHRGGGRNSDQLPASENTAELVRLAERFGANAVEIDVQLTKDGVPVIYHDEFLNLRLTQKTGLVGRIGDYTFAQIEAFVRLENGERIPSLRRMLSVILRRTGLRFVWLDSKPDMPIAIMRDVQRMYADSARLFGRDLRIVIGLPSEEKLEEFLRLPDYADAPAICELTPDDVRRCNALVWGPRWTLGTQNDAVAALQAEGRMAFVWTIDLAGYLQTFMTDGRFDGIVTNYPSLVAFYHYVR